MQDATVTFPSAEESLLPMLQPTFSPQLLSNQANLLQLPSSQATLSQLLSNLATQPHLSHQTTLPQHITHPPTSGQLLFNQANLLQLLFNQATPPQLLPPLSHLRSHPATLPMLFSNQATLPHHHQSNLPQLFFNQPPPTWSQLVPRSGRLLSPEAQEEAITDLENQITALEEKINVVREQSNNGLVDQNQKRNALEENLEMKIQALDQKTSQHSAHCGYQLGSESLKTPVVLADSAIPYSILMVDTGVSSLDPATGIWTAGLDGTYQVSWSLSSGIEKGKFNLVVLAKDGKRVGETEHFSGSLYNTVGELWDQGGRSLVLGLKRGQTLELRARKVDSVYKIIFCVSLLHADQ